MALCDAGALLVGDFLVLLVMAMVGVDEVTELANLVLEVNGTDFGIVEIGGYYEKSSGSARVLHAIAGLDFEAC